MSAATSGDHSNTAPDIASLIRATSNNLDCFAARMTSLCRPIVESRRHDPRAVVPKWNKPAWNTNR